VQGHHHSWRSPSLPQSIIFVYSSTFAAPATTYMYLRLCGAGCQAAMLGQVNSLCGSKLTISKLSVQFDVCQEVNIAVFRLHKQTIYWVKRLVGSVRAPRRGWRP
jgi:hypothetical protein